MGHSKKEVENMSGTGAGVGQLKWGKAESTRQNKALCSPSKSSSLRCECRQDVPKVCL